MPSNTEIVRRQFAAYLDQDAETADALLDESLTFTSPQDDHIGKADFFEHCFPTVDRLAWQELREVVDMGDGLVLIRYEYELRDGGRFQNVEAITVDDGRITDIQVYFGGRAEPPS